MDVNRISKDPSLVCTCSELLLEDIKDSIRCGFDDPKDVMFDHATQFRCGECKPIIQRMIDKGRS